MIGGAIMRNASLALLMGMMLFVLSCGGGSSDNATLPPAERDLSGLEGIWDYTAIYDGTMSGPGGSGPISFKESGYLEIDRTSLLSKIKFEQKA